MSHDRSLSAGSILGQRETQEDRFVYFDVDEVLHKGWFLAVMDGHNGPQAAHYCAEKIKTFFLDIARKVEDIQLVLGMLVQKLHQKTQGFDGGTTVSIVFIDTVGSTATVAVLGDSPVLVVAEHEWVSYSPTHNVESNKEEALAVQRRGARLEGSYMCHPRYPQFGLQLTRALGDSIFDDFLNRTPEIYTVSSPTIVLLASDGLLSSTPSAIDDEQSSELNRLLDQKASASDLLAWRESSETLDNVTIVVWYAE